MASLINALSALLFVYQLNAFFMTLRKKRIVGPNTVQALYSLLLLSVTYVSDRSRADAPSLCTRQHQPNTVQALYSLLLLSVTYMSDRSRADTLSLCTRQHQPTTAQALYSLLLLSS